MNGLRIYDSNRPGYVVPPTLINEYSALTIPAYWRAVCFLSDNLATFPRAVRRDGVKVAHGLDRLLERKPNQYETATVWFRTYFAHAVQFGNGYARIQRASPTSLKPVGLYHLLPDDVTPFRYEGQQWYYHKPVKGEAEVIPAADVLHLPGLGFDGMVGYSPVCLMRGVLDRAATLDRYQTKFLQRGTVLRGAIEVPGGVSDARLDQMVATLRSYFSGADSERDVIVLSDGATLNNQTLSPESSQLDKQIASSVKQISQITGVPPAFLFDLSEGKYNNALSELGGYVVRYTFRPWLELIEDELTTKLLTEQEQDAGLAVKLDPNELLRGSPKEIEDIATASVKGGTRTRNEARAMIGLPADPDPASDKLSTLGDTAPQAVRQPPATVQSTSSATPGTAYAALAPVIAAAVERVEAKTAKAFDAHGQRPDAERTIWANVFAEQQGKHVREALAPIVESLTALDAGQRLDVDAIADRYAAAIRRQASTGEAADLDAIIRRIMEGESNE